MANRPSHPESLDAALGALDALSYVELKARWRALGGAPFPARLSRDLLRRAVAYRIQEQALGGLDRATRQKLERAANDLADHVDVGVAQPAPPHAFKKDFTHLRGRDHGVQTQTAVALFKTLEMYVEAKETPLPYRGHAEIEKPAVSATG